jgi:RHS repeat-associated protein
LEGYDSVVPNRLRAQHSHSKLSHRGVLLAPLIRRRFNGYYYDVALICLRKYTGKERDAETNNDDFGARYYSSQFGRWISPDWSAISAPVPYANLSNPQTLNLYAMVRDNPETFADLDGHCDWCQKVKNYVIYGRVANPSGGWAGGEPFRAAPE